MGDALCILIVAATWIAGSGVVALMMGPWNPEEFKWP